MKLDPSILPLRSTDIFRKPSVYPSVIARSNSSKSTLNVFAPLDSACEEVYPTWEISGSVNIMCGTHEYSIDFAKGKKAFLTAVLAEYSATWVNCGPPFTSPTAPTLLLLVT